MADQRSVDQDINMNLILYFSVACFVAGVNFLGVRNSEFGVALVTMSALLVGVYEMFFFQKHKKWDSLVAGIALAAVSAAMYWWMRNILIIVVIIVVAGLTALLLRYVARKQDEFRIEIERTGHAKIYRVFLWGGNREIWRELTPARRWGLAFSMAAAVLPTMVVIWLAALTMHPKEGNPYLVLAIMFSPFVTVAGMAGLSALLTAAVYEKKSLQIELRAANEVQMGLMPLADPQVQGFDISGICRPALEVGGDYYDFLWLDAKQTKLGIAVADVSGKAMKAAMTAVMTSGMVYSEVGNSKSPREILRKLNRPMYLKTSKRVFTAMSFAVIDTRKKSLTFSNAGQTSPILVRNGKSQFLKVKGERLPLGIKEELNYEEMSLKLRKGDIIVFYTDGLPEAANTMKEMYGFDKLDRHVKNLAGISAKVAVEQIIADVEEFSGQADQHDDMTVVVVRVL